MEALENKIKLYEKAKGNIINKKQDVLNL